jgi:hypothetical protein
VSPSGGTVAGGSRCLPGSRIAGINSTANGGGGSELPARAGLPAVPRGLEGAAYRIPLSRTIGLTIRGA